VPLVLRRAGGRFYCEVHLYALSLEGAAPAGGADVRVLAPSEIAAYVALRAGEDAASVQARLDRGDLCFTTWEEGRLVGGVWVRFDRMWVSELDRFLPLREGDAYGYDSFTDPAHRGRGAATARAEALIRHLQDRGYRRLVAYVAAGNMAGRAAVERLGFEDVGRIRRFHVGRFGLELQRGSRARASRGYGRPDALWFT
jgi:RimJ/RimL family protein N-acetyltransferase